jgi:hypothetical protein
MATVHLAGPIVTVDNRVIQRCAVCGQKLVDLEAFEPGKPVVEEGCQLRTVVSTECYNSSDLCVTLVEK